MSYLRDIIHRRIGGHLPDQAIGDLEATLRLEVVKLFQQGQREAQKYHRAGAGDHTRYVGAYLEGAFAALLGVSVEELQQPAATSEAPAPAMPLTELVP